MTRKRTARPSAEAAAEDGAGTLEPLTDTEAVPEDLAAAALAERQAAKDADEQAIQRRAEAESVVTAANADAERIRREGHARALPLIADANAAEHRSAELGGRSKHLEHAARQKALAEEHEARAAALSTELEHLTGVIIAGMDSQLSQLGTDQERLRAEKAEARTVGDASRLEALSPKLDATSDAIEGLGGERTRAQARADQIGDGTGPGELLDALTAASAHRTALTKALDELYPDRPGAELRRDLAELKGALEGNLARVAEEAKPETTRRRAGFAAPH